MEKNVLLIINPNSGDGEAKHWLYDMTEALLSRYLFVTVYFSKCRGDILRTVADRAKDFDAVICCGGDGTLNETVSGIEKSGLRLPLGYIPTGTVNDFASSHGIPKGIRGAIDKICTGEPHPYDIGLLGDRPFSYVAAFGAFTDVAYLTPQISKAAFGKAAYFAEGVKRILSLAPISAEITADGQKISGEFLFGMAANAKTVGGFRFFDGETAAQLCDGKLELVLIRYPKNPMLFQETLMGLLNPKIQSDTVIRLTAEDFTFHFPNGAVSWTMDGEFGGDYDTVRIRCVRERILVIE